MDLSFSYSEIIKDKKSFNKISMLIKLLPKHLGKNRINYEEPNMSNIVKTSGY